MDTQLHEDTFKLKSNNRECHSPLGLFEKFKVEIPPDPDLQFSSVPESPLKFETEHYVVTPDPQNVKKLILNKASLINKLCWMMNTASPDNNVDDLQPNGVKVVFYRGGEDDSCILVGSWNANAKEVEILDELENPSDDAAAEYQILVPNVSNDDDVIICEENGQLSQKKVKHLLETAGPNDNPQDLGDQTNLKVKVGKIKSKKKICDREKSHNSLIVTSTKSPKAIRDTTVQALQEVLMKRIKEIQTLDVPEKTLKKLAKNVEKEIFSLYHNTGMRYKIKYRSLLFNLKDPRNMVFFQRVVLGEITPQCLVQMSPTDMAHQQLTDWRNQARKHTLEIIEKTEKELNQKQQMIKLTHKGLIEIDTSPDQMFTLEDLSGASCCSKNVQTSNVEIIAEKTTDTTAQHKTHLLDLNCLICMGKIKATDTNMSQWTKVKSPNKIGNDNSYVEKLLFSDTGVAFDSNQKHTLGTKSHNASSSQSEIWKGFIQMFSIKHFKVFAIQVSGYTTHLCKELPKMITSKGFISPESVWEYVDLIWPASTKDMCLLQLCPQTSRDAVFYSRLYSYLSCKLKYVIISINKMEAFIIPLAACQPLPSKLQPLGGPGLNDDHPNILLALLLPNHPCWSSCPRKVRKKQREKELDVPDDIFLSILEDVQREENLMAEQGLPAVGQQSTGVAEVGMPELINLLCLLSNNLQEIALQNNNNSVPPANQPNPIQGTAPVWPSYPLPPSFQAPAYYNNNPAAMFDPSTIYNPSGFNPYTF